jgi:hypothetical protein
MRLLIFFMFFFCFNNFLYSYLRDMGVDDIVHYEKYGYFENLNKDNYKYVLLDERGLSESLGEGIYPNIWSVFANPLYTEYLNLGMLEGNRWDFLFFQNMSLAYIKWASSAQEDYAVKQFYISEIFEKSGLIKQAIKSYYSILVFFPKETLDVYSSIYSRDFIYLGEESLNRIKFLTSKYKKLNIDIVDAKVDIEHKFDNDKKNDVFSINPGRLIYNKNLNENFNSSDLIEQKKYKNIVINKYKNGHWQLFVDNKPFIVKAVYYSPLKMGDKLYSSDWTLEDENKNGKIDAPFDVKIKGKRSGDFYLMKKMGVNTVFLDSNVSNKNILKLLYKKYGIRVVFKITINLKDYQKNKTKIQKKIIKIIDSHKYEKYLFMWEISFIEKNIDNKKENSFYIINEIAKFIKILDKDHPIILTNKGLKNLDLISGIDYKNNFDILKIDTYNSSRGFGYSFWKDLRRKIDLPILPQTAISFIEDNDILIAHKNIWKDVENNIFGKGFGNCIGIIIFEWLDNWARVGKINKQEKVLIKDKYDDFFGIFSQQSRFDRKPKSTYFFYKEKWKEFRYV